MRVLVTGHLGYVGAVLTPMLLERGHEVIGLDSDLYRRCSTGDGLAQTPKLEKDIRDAESSDFDGADAVVHLAGLSNDPLGSLDPELTHEINHRASVRVAECAKRAGVSRLVLASSCSVYGSSGADWVDESARLRPITPYAESKANMERDIAPLADRSFAPVFMRNATAFGPSPRLRFDLVVNNFAAWGVSTGRIVLKSDGSAWRPLVHVEDIARAAVAAIEAPTDDIRGRVLNVGATSMNHRISDVADAVRTAAPECRVEMEPGATADRRCYRVRCDRLDDALPDARPLRSLHDGIVGVVEWMRGQTLSPEAFEGPRFARLEHIRWLLEQGLIGNDLRVRA
ncbi:MAG: SDR family oxidoreductase [Planctomycetota bacterium]